MHARKIRTKENMEPSENLPQKSNQIGGRRMLIAES
jgi:hypothetical protein